MSSWRISAAGAPTQARSSISRRAASAVLRLLFGPIGRLLRFRSCGAIASVLAPVLWKLGVRRSITLRNLAIAFPTMAHAERERIARSSYRSLVTVLLEILTLRWLSVDELQSLISFENAELLCASDGRGAVLLSAHYGNWELLALGAGMAAPEPISVVVTEQNDFGELERTRTAFGNRLIPTGRGARGAASVLVGGGAVAMLADQSARGGEPRLPIFGVDVPWFSAPARLALRFDTRVIVGYAERRSDGGYHVHLREIRHDDLPDSNEGVEALLGRYVETLEQAVRDRPEQWVWQHRRFKHVPGVSYDA